VTSEIAAPASRLLQDTSQTKNYKGVLMSDKGSDVTSTATLAALSQESQDSITSAITGQSGHTLSGAYANNEVAEPSTLVVWVKEPTSATATPGTNNVTIGLESNATNQD